MPSSFSTATACTANASFSSKRSTSFKSQPAFSATRRTASTGVISTNFGARPLVAWPTMRARGARPSDFARSAAITTSADAPSLTPGALPAVTVPSVLNAGFSAASPADVVSPRMASSRSKTIGSPVFCGSAIGRAAVQRRLTRRMLAEPRRDDVAHDAFVDNRGVDPGAAHRLGDDQRAQRGRGHRFQRTQKLAGWGADRADDYGFSHTGL